MRPTTFLAPLAVLLLAGCGSGGGTTASSTTTSKTPSTSTSPAGGAGHGIHAASTSLGTVLVDGSGLTVYLLTADTPNKSTCDNTCLTYWPAVAPPSGTSATGVTAPIGHTTTPGGTAIATAGGWPLYTYVQDKAPGDVTGEGVKTFGGTWYAVSPSGQPVKGGSTSSGTPSSSGGGGTGY